MSPIIRSSRANARIGQALHVRCEMPPLRRSIAHGNDSSVAAWTRSRPAPRERRASGCHQREASVRETGAFPFSDRCKVGVIHMCKLCLAIALLFAVAAGTILAMAPHHPASASAASIGHSASVN
jgi:hypothetical protein